MTDAHIISPACPSCGATSNGRFCTHCGAAVGAQTGGLFHAVAADVLKLNERRGYLSTYATILKAPISATMRLFEDASYRNYGSFFLTSSAIFLTLFGFAPHVLDLDPMVQYGWLTPEGVDLLQQFQGAVRSIASYSSVVLTFFVTYLLFKLIARTKRTPREFLKFMFIVAGFTTPLFSLAFVWPLLMPGQSPMEQVQVAAISSGILSLAGLIVYIIPVYRRFWGTGIVGTVGMIMVSGAISQIGVLGLSALMARIINTVAGISSG